MCCESRRIMGNFRCKKDDGLETKIRIPKYSEWEIFLENVSAFCIGTFIIHKITKASPCDPQGPKCKSNCSYSRCKTKMMGNGPTSYFFHFPMRSFDY